MVIDVTTPEDKYPKEDKCRYCGEHVGWIMHPMAEALALGCCDKQKCQEKLKHDVGR